MPPQRRFARTGLEKWAICQARQKLGQRSGEMTLEEFCKLYPNPDGNPMPVSSMSLILRRTDIENPPIGAAANRMKGRQEQFPIFERVLAEWIEKAVVAKVLISDEIIREQGRILMLELDQRIHMCQIQHFEENYYRFEMSNGWLGRFKTRNSLAKQKYAGNAGSTDPESVEPARISIQKSLERYEPDNVYNIDETAFQYNLRPNATISYKGKAPRGEKKIKTRITVFFVVNADGLDKYKLSVINKYKQPLCFRAAGINIGNLPIYYYHNKTAWMQVSIWFHFLHQFDQYMRIAHRQVVLISDNAPIHPDPVSPPKNYSGASPPTLTNVRILYIDPNLTAYLQPLDAGIIAAFKAAYRRKYASLLVCRYNTNSTTAVDWKLNILEAINLAVEAWDDIPASTIFHCWQKTGILSQIDRSIVGHYDQFLFDQQESTRISIASLLNHEGSTCHDLEEATKSYLLHDEDAASSTVEAKTVSMFTHVTDCVSAGLTTTAGIDNDLESLYEGDISLTPPPIISGTTALVALQDLTQYFQSLSITSLPSTQTAPLNISDIAKLLSSTHQALHQHLETQKTQSNLDSWLQRTS